MAAESWMVIVNPKAGSGRGLKDWPVISNLMYNSGLKFTCVFTEHKFHAIELTVSAVNNGYRHIVAVGGDGTIHEVVNGIFIQKAVPTTDIFLAVIPVLGIGLYIVARITMPLFKAGFPKYDALNESVKAIQDLNLTGDVSTASSDLGDSSADAKSNDTSAATEDTATEDTTAATETTAADTADASADSKPQGDYTPYSYTDVYRNGNDLTVIPNGQLNASTVLFENKDFAGFLDYVDSTVLEEGRTINRELFYGLLSTMLIDKELSEERPESI